MGRRRGSGEDGWRSGEFKSSGEDGWSIKNCSTKLIGCVFIALISECWGMVPCATRLL